MENRKYIEGQEVVKRLLRQEVAFGCPICRNPFLTYHHFDSPWREDHHWNPAGMIALCREHHDWAEGGHYTKQDLLKLKSATYSVTDIKKRFPWTRNQFLVRVGGLYSGGSKTVIKIDGQSVIEITTGDDGLLFVAFELRSKDGNIIARMTDNVFEAGPYPPSDLYTTTTASRIKVWYEPGNIALNVTLRRITTEKLETILHADKTRLNNELNSVYTQIQEQLTDSLQHLPPDIVKRINEDFASTVSPKSPESISMQIAKFHEKFGETNLPEEFLKAHFSGDSVGYSVETWATANCIDSDGLISLLNFENLSVYTQNKHIHIQNGIGNVAYNAVFDCDTAFSF